MNISETRQNNQFDNLTPVKDYMSITFEGNYNNYNNCLHLSQPFVVLRAK